MSTTIKAGRISVEISNPGKVLFPGDHTTKGHLAEYYHAVARWMLPYLRDRPVAMERYPDGIDGERVFQKDVPDYFPEWVTRAPIERINDGKLDQVVCDRAATLVYLADQACVTPHAFLSRTDQLHHPDQLVFDLDPASGDDFDAARRAAASLRDLLEDELGLRAYVKTSGGKGLHPALAHRE